MSRITDYMDESCLFDPVWIVDAFARLSDAEIEGELGRYREFRLADQQLAVPEQGLSIVPDRGRLVAMDTLKQAALYMDTALVEDPLFSFSEPITPERNMWAVLSTGWGIERDRSALTEIVTYMHELRRSVDAGVVRLVPFEAQRAFDGHPMPMKSVTSVRGQHALPEDVVRLFLDRLEVQDRDNNNRPWTPISDLGATNRFGVRFKGDIESRVGQYSRIARTPVRQADGRVHMAYSNPVEAPAPQDFIEWALGCIYQTAMTIVADVKRDLAFADAHGALYQTSSSLVADLITHSTQGDGGLREDVLKYTLQLNVPVLNEATLDEVVDVREKEGDAFQAFRRHLESTLKELRLVTDATELQRRIENVSHEITEVQVADVERKVKAVRRNRNMMLTSTALTVSAAILPLGIGISSAVVGALGFLQAMQTRNALQDQVKENPAYFLWKLRRR